MTKGVAPPAERVENMKIKFTHTNIIAKDWKKLSHFYQEVLDVCRYRRNETCKGTGSIG